jgi:hypothetical protein
MVQGRGNGFAAEKYGDDLLAADAKMQTLIGRINWDSITQEFLMHVELTKDDETKSNEYAALNFYERCSWLSDMTVETFMPIEPLDYWLSKIIHEILIAHFTFTTNYWSTRME